MPEMPENFVAEVSERYIELFESITGEKFIKSDTDQIMSRIEKNVLSFLNK